MQRRLDDLIRLYSILDRLERRIGGRRLLASSDGRSRWPERGVYFFMEDGEIPNRHRRRPARRARGKPSSVEAVVTTGTTGAMSSPLSSFEAKELIRLCESGRLYEVEAWLAAGKSLTVPKEVRKTPLRTTGFHSLVGLLLRHELRQGEKDDALRHALFLNRFEFVELAVEHGASIGAIPFLDVLMTGDRALVATFLDKGADATTGYPFARAFHQLRAKTTLGSYLDCRRSRPDLAEHLQQQADMALRQFCQEGNLKWVSLLMWAGANPRSRGPALDDADHIEGAKWHTTALAEACYSGSVESLKRLKPSPTDDLAGMLERAAFSAHRDVLAYLLDLGANPNDRLTVDRPRSKRVHVQRIIAVGVSQGAIRLVDYHNAVHPLAGVFDAFIPLLGGGFLRTDLGVKAFKVLCETDIRREQVLYRQPDSDEFRRWEVAGTAHFDFRILQQVVPLQTRDLGFPQPVGSCAVPPFSRIPLNFLANAALDRTVEWIEKGIAPSTAPEIETIDTPDVIARDDFGNALGGIRLSQHAVPTATNTGWNGPGNVCVIYGSYVPFTDETLAALYADHGAYVDQVARVTADNRMAGYIVVEDAAATIRDAAGSNIGKR